MINRFWNQQFILVLREDDEIYTIKVEVYEKNNFAQKIEKYVKFNRPKGFFSF